MAAAAPEVGIMAGLQLVLPLNGGTHLSKPPKAAHKIFMGLANNGVCNYHLTEEYTPPAIQPLAPAPSGKG